MNAERGFTLIEVLIATAIAGILACATLSLLHVAVLASASSNARVVARTSTDRLGDELETDAAAAWSVFVPPTGVLGDDNGDGHEIDFVMEDDSHRQVWWAYSFDSTERTVTRYAYAPGKTPQAGDVYGGIAQLTARTYPITDVADATSQAYDPLFAKAIVTAVEFDYGFGGKATGGNHLVRVHLRAAGVDRRLLLSAGTAPTHYSEVLQYTPPP